MASTARQTFCRQASNKEFFQNRLASSESRIAFDNEKKYSAFNLVGIDGVKVGICWWHSRFQRSLNYLAVARPLNKGESRMTDQEIRAAINDVINETNVVELRGYKSILEFTEQNKEIILHFLTYWQLTEVPQAARGLVGSSKADPENLKTKMHELYKDVMVNKTIQFQVQQLEGIEAHSWIVFGMAKTFKNKKWVGYTILAVDSERATSVDVVHYTFGDTQIGTVKNSYVPYTQRPQSELRYFTALAYYCKPEKTKAHLKDKFIVPAPTDGFVGEAIQPYAFDKSYLSPAKWAQFLK
jgi:hypothetical protein